MEIQYDGERFGKILRCGLSLFLFFGFCEEEETNE